jgi:hypothetical protein
MKTIEAYRLIYSILDSYWNRIKNDDLALLLTDMQPCDQIEGCVRGTGFSSWDPSVYLTDWSDSWNAIIGEGEDGTNAQIFEVAKSLLGYYVNEVNYDLDDAETAVAEGLGLKKKPRRENRAAKEAVA